MPPIEPPAKGADPGGNAAVANTFHSDLDGDGVPDRLVLTVGNNASGSKRDLFQIFVVRGSCGHWLGSIIDGGDTTEIHLAPESHLGLRVLEYETRVSGGYELDQYRWNGTHYALFGHRYGGRDGDTEWQPARPDSPPQRPVFKAPL